MMSDVNRAITIAIMAGGGSRRMGRDKAAIPVGGVPMLERVARAAVGTGLPVVVIGRERPEEWPLDSVRFYPDRYPGAGPLGGLATALRICGTSVLLLACDMPLVTAEAIGWLIEQDNREADNDGVIPLNDGKLEPLFAIYHPTSLSMADALLSDGEFSMKRMIDGGNFTRIEMPKDLLECIRNINRETDLAELNAGRGSE